MSSNWPDIAGRLEAGKHILPVRVYYEDTDFGGSVYHSNYLKYCERGRSDFLRLLGIFHKDIQAGKYDGKSLGFAVRNVDSHFLAPASIDDLLEVHTQFIETRGARLKLSQEVKLGDVALYQADITVVMIDGLGKPVRVPKEIIQALQNGA